MPYRSPARFLAPLALFLAVVTIFVVARPELGGSDDLPSAPAPSTTTARKTPTKTTSSTRTTAGGRATGAKAKTYTVKAGDVLGSISESTGVPVADLLELNDLEDAQSLRVGQKLKLAP